MQQSLIETSNFKRILVRATALPLLVMVALTVALVLETAVLLDAAQWVDHTDRVSAQITVARQLAQDIASAHRGFLLTGEPAEQARARTDGVELRHSLEDLAQMVGDNPTETARAARISAQVTELLAALASEQELRISSNDYMASYRTKRTANLANAIDLEFERFRATEEGLRQQRESETRRLSRLGTAAIFTLFVLFSILVTFAIRSQMRALVLSYEGARSLAAERMEALEKGEEWLSTILRSIGDAVIATDREARITFMNPVAEALTGATEADACGAALTGTFRIVDESTRETAGNPVARALDLGATVILSDQSLLIGRNGIETVISHSSAPIRDRAGIVVGAALVFHDITDQTRSERALRESEERYRFLADAMPQIVWMARPDGSMDYFNQRWYDFTGLTFAQSKDWGWQSAVHPDDVRTSLDKWGEAVRTGGVFEAEYRFKRASDGAFRWRLGRAIPMRGEDGAIMRWFGTSTDIDDQKRAEDTVRESEERFRVMADSAPILLWMSSQGADRYFFNRPWLEFTGRALEEEADAGWMDRVHPDDLQPALDTQFGACNNRENFDVEYRLLRRDGVYRSMLDRGTPRYTPDGGFAGYIGSCIDITDRKQLEAQLFQSQKMEGIGRLAGGVAHDFNNLLTAMMGYAELAESRDLGDDAIFDDLRAIQQSAGRAAELTRQLLAFARRQVIAPRVISLNDLIANIERLLRRLIGEDIELMTRPQSDLGSVKVDPGQIEQVIINLAVNARDAMPEGGRLLIETMNTRFDALSRPNAEMPPGEYIMVAVSDTGAGIDESVKPHLFEPFFTTKEGGKGTGLGLATCYGIAKQSGGHIDVKSEPGSGATFLLYLPRVEAPVEAVVSSVTRVDRLPAGSETLLLVEDEPIVRDLAVRVLKAQGYRVIEAPNGAEALKITRDPAIGPSIQIVVSDVVMPTMSGAELAAKLWEERPDIKLLLVSGYTEDATARREIRDFGIPFLQKPFTPMALARKVREVLDSDSTRLSRRPPTGETILPR